ncbi:MAG TPA: methyltransferase [Thermoanaerobaculia bacterium]|jgi:SAM-dependent methyltransferase
MTADTLAHTTPDSAVHPPDAMPPAAVLLQMMDGIKVTQLIHAAAKLGIADLLVVGPKSSEELAAAVGANPGALYRVLRALAGLGIFREIEGGRFDLTPLAEPLRSDVPGSVRAWATVCGEDWHLRMWSDILYSVRTGLGAFPNAHGMGSFEYFQHHPDKGAVFYEAMTNLTAQVSAAVLAAYDFSAARKIVDVGCGNGTFTTAILGAYPHLTGTLFDIPPVIEVARGVIGAAGLAERCDFVAGDFFESVAAGGDTYVLKNIIHDWSEERAATILRNCRQVMPRDGRVLIVEMVVQPGNDPSPAKMFDITMLVAEGGQERTEAEQRRLLEAAGLKLSRIVPTPSPVSVIEAVPA